MNKHTAFAVLLAASMLPQTALAYIGPGAGLSAIGTVVAVLGAFLLLIVGFVWYPIKRLLRRTGVLRAPVSTEETPERETP